MPVCCVAYIFSRMVEISLCLNVYFSLQLTCISKPGSVTFLMLCSVCVLFTQVLPVNLPSSDKMVFRKPPDGGWGWVIVVVSFFTQFLCYGSPLAVGVLYVEWLDAFGEGKGKTAWVGSLANGIGLLASKCRCSICLKSKGFFLIDAFICVWFFWIILKKDSCKW